MNLTAEEMFNEYRGQTEQAVKSYNALKTRFPARQFPSLASRIWRAGMLAEMSGTIATRLTRKDIDYLDNWRRGVYHEGA